MKRFLTLAFAVLSLISCQDKEATFHLSGKVEGLREGKLLLQRVEDTSVIDLDSMEIYGDPTYELSARINEPEILYLYLDRTGGDENDNVVQFFAEKGEMTLNTTLNNFTVDAKIKGSENQELLRKYDSVMNLFNNNNLDLLKANFEAAKRNDTTEIQETTKKYRNLLKRKYLYTVNYTVNNKTKEIAPYLAVTQISNANIKYLDTIYKSLNRKIQKSKYGEKLEKLIEERKEVKKNLPEKSKGRKPNDQASSGENVLGE
jgi:hypothetical protein